MTKYYKRSYILGVCFLLITISAWSQQRSCGVWNPSQQSRLSQEKKRTYLQRVRQFHTNKQSYSRNSSICTNPTRLPIAIHFQGISNPDDNCIKSLVRQQVEILNDALQGTTPDTTLWKNTAANFPNIEVGKACLELVLANKNHPDGYGLTDGDISVTINTTTGDNLPDWNGYINVVVRDIIDLGYAPLGGLGDADVINIDISAFGTFGCGEILPYPAYNKGRTLVHELGHYLYLNHIWANDLDVGGCTEDDGVDDTPISEEPHFGCPDISSSCGSPDLHMNYMDYVNDACMFVFTAGQAARMENWVNTSLQALVNNVDQVYDEPFCESCTPSLCTDADNDGYCSALDCDDNNDKIPAESGSSCDDGNPNTYNDIIQLDGCTCQGISNTCLTMGGDQDGDGVCDEVDCNPEDACYPKAAGTACDDGIAATTNDQIQLDGCTCVGSTRVMGKIYLQGLYDTNTQAMKDDLQMQNLLPVAQPYSQSPWNYAGTESVTTFPATAVDWILIMSRDANDTILSQAVGFVNTAGELIDLAGNFGIPLSQAYGNYISVHHRNHLAVLSASTYTNLIDFTTSASTVKGIQQLKNVNGNFCMYSGDFDGSGIVNNQDYNDWVQKKSQLNQYLSVDGDGNGVVNNLDYNLWIGTGAKIGHESIQY